MRFNEAATLTGYAWEVPNLEQLTCVELQDENVGNFTTGYQQI
jgi:hypothetical protein